MLGFLQVVSRGIRWRCGALCPFGSLDRGVCGLVVGDGTPWIARVASIPLGRLPLPATSPLTAAALSPVLLVLIVEESMPRRKTGPSRPDAATEALLHTLHPHAAGSDRGATEVGVCVPPRAVLFLPTPSSPPLRGRFFAKVT